MKYGVLKKLIFGRNEYDQHQALVPAAAIAIGKAVPLL
jgi:hypothetical protein